MNRRFFLQTSATLAAVGGVAPLAAQSKSPAGMTPLSGVDPERWGRNPKIQDSRKVALDLLKPTAAQLERGLALHADALVFDAYGFSPRAAPTAIDEINRAIKAGASADEVIQLITDSSMAGFVDDQVEREEYEDAWTAAGVTATWQQAGEETQNPLVMLRRLSCYTSVMDAMPEFLVRTNRVDEILRAKKQGRHVMCLSTNGVPLRQQWESVEGELRFISVFQRLGIRMMQITYNRRTMIGDGCGEAANAGLSDFGRTVVAEMNRLGVIVDLAHAGWRTALEAARISKRPVVASHSACAAINPHIRALPDDVLRATVDSGGYIGITCWPRFMGRTGDLRAILDHVDYVVKTFGVDHVAIGTDRVYTSRHHETQLKKLTGRPRSRTPWSKLWPPGQEIYLPQNEQERLAFARPDVQAKSMEWTNWPLFTVGLVQRGYSDDDIRKIIGGNVLRVLPTAVPWNAA